MFNIFTSITSFFKERVLIFNFIGIFNTLFYSKSSKIKNADVLLTFHDNYRTTFFEGLRYAPIIDSIITDIGLAVSTITLPAPFSRHFGKTCYGNVVMYNRKLLWAYIVRLITKRCPILSNEENDPVVNFWLSTLKKIQPKVIIGVNPSIELCIASRTMNIWIADIQHGIFTFGNYYDLNKRAHINQNGWPSCILCWDQYSKDFIDSNFSLYVQSSVVGNPAIFSRASNNLVKDKETNTQNNSQINVLVSLSTNRLDDYTKDIYFRKIGIPFQLVNFIKTSGSFCNWKLRLHPAQFATNKNKVYGELNRIFKDLPNVMWETCNANPFHIIVQKQAAHITFNSASAREASMVNINTAILDPDPKNNNNYFGDLIKTGKVKVMSLENHNILKQWIIDCFKEKAEINNNNIEPVLEGHNQFNAFIENIRSRVFSDQNS